MFVCSSNFFRPKSKNNVNYPGTYVKLPKKDEPNQFSSYQYHKLQKNLTTLYACFGDVLNSSMDHIL